MFNLLTFTLYLSHIYRYVINVQTLLNAADISKFTYTLKIPFKAMSTLIAGFWCSFSSSLRCTNLKIKITHVDNKETISIFTTDYIQSCSGGRKNIEPQIVM